MLTRRSFLASAFFAVTASAASAHYFLQDPRFVPQLVPDPTGEPVGTVVVRTREFFLFLVLGEGSALRYGVGVGRQGFSWTGVAKIGRKAEWPTWTPPSSMIEREPKLAKWRRGMPGGPSNPLGARALYLYQDGRDTLYRIHGTNEPSSIGRAVSSGCVRMVNNDIKDLYTRVSVGTRVIVEG